MVSFESGSFRGFEANEYESTVGAEEGGLKAPVSGMVRSLVLPVTSCTLLSVCKLLGSSFCV